MRAGPILTFILLTGTEGTFHTITDDKNIVCWLQISPIKIVFTVCPCTHTIKSLKTFHYITYTIISKNILYSHV